MAEEIGPNETWLLDFIQNGTIGELAKGRLLRAADDLRRAERERAALLAAMEHIRTGALGRQHKDPWAAAVLRTADKAIRATEGREGE